MGADWAMRIATDPPDTAAKARSSNHVSRNLDEIDLKILRFADQCAVSIDE